MVSVQGDARRRSRALKQQGLELNEQERGTEHSRGGRKEKGRGDARREVR